MENRKKDATSIEDVTDPPRNPYEFTREAYNELIKNMPKDRFNQRSEYEEIELIEDCTLFDIYRQPRAPITDPTATRTLSMRSLNAELTCPICLGIIRNAMVVMECLHRFCSDCIQRCLRMSMKECPSCRIHIPSKRSMRKDENFDQLIHKIYPNLVEYERKEDKLIEEINKKRHFHNAVTESTKIGVENQASMRRNGKKKPHSEVAVSTTTNGTSTTATSEEQAHKRARTSRDEVSSSTTSPSSSIDESVQASETVRVNFRVRLHEKSPSAPNLEKQFLCVAQALKISHLKKHLAKLLGLDSYTDMRIVLPQSNCYHSGLMTPTTMKEPGAASVRKDLRCDQELEDYVTIYDIYQQYGMGTSWELELLYHFSDTIINGVAQFISNGL